MIPQSEPEHKDLVDVLIQSSQKMEEVVQEDGTIDKQLYIDPKSVFYKTNMVASPYFSRLVFELENFFNLSKQCYNFMSPNRAKNLGQQLYGIYLSWIYSIDAKSSESIRSNGSAQSTYIDKISRNKIERSYKVEGEKKRSMLESLMGKDRDDDMDND